MSNTKSNKESSKPARVRLDKWLWAARFYKTRAIAKQAIDGGKVQYQGARTKPSKEIELGAQVKLRQGFDEKTVLIRALSEQRRGAPEAQLLYEEAAASIELRLRNSEQRKSQPAHWPPASKPNKKQRRLIHKFKHREGN